MAKAAILEKVGGLTIGEVELADPGPHEVLIDTKACGLCHSDLHFIDGAYPHPKSDADDGEPSVSKFCPPRASALPGPIASLTGKRWATVTFDTAVSDCTSLPIY